LFVKAGWDVHAEIHEEVSFSSACVIVSGMRLRAAKRSGVDYVLCNKPNKMEKVE
jgi:type I site-specific restriction endonuclease